MKRKTTLLILLTWMLLSCSANKNDDMRKEQGKFTWNVQLAGYDYSRADQKGDTDFQNFINEFDKFPWMEQLDSYQRIQQGCSPTMSVKDLETKKTFGFQWQAIVMNMVT